MEIKIEKEVPIPGAKSRGALSASIRAMSPGDSFAVPRDKANMVRSAFNYALLKSGGTFITRQEGDDKVRFWRTS